MRCWCLAAYTESILQVLRPYRGLSLKLCCYVLLKWTLSLCAVNLCCIFFCLQKDQDRKEDHVTLSSLRMSPVPRLTTWHVCSINPSREALLTTWHIYPLVFSVHSWIQSASSSIQHLACHWLSPQQHVQWYCGSVVTDEDCTGSHLVLCKNPRAWALSWEHRNQNSWCQGDPAVRILSFRFSGVFIW